MVPRTFPESIILRPKLSRGLGEFTGFADEMVPLSVPAYPSHVRPYSHNRSSADFLSIARGDD